jgi:hypothetical protein
MPDPGTLEELMVFIKVCFDQEDECMYNPLTCDSFS